MGTVVTRFLNPFESPLLPRFLRRLYASLYRSICTSRELVIGLVLGASLSGATGAIAVYGRTRWRQRLEARAREVQSSKPIEIRSGEVVDGVTGLIGNTPLIRIPSLSRLCGCDILGKCEFLNPGGSVKDRVSLKIISSAEESGWIKPYTNPRSKIFEGTSGSTGISIALVSNALGYDSEITLPDDTSREKAELMEKLGATVIRVRPVSIVDPKHYVNLARQRALHFGSITLKSENDHSVAVESEDDDVVVRSQQTQEELWHNEQTLPEHESRGFFADQFENKSNFLAHYEGTGPEIWIQTHGEIEAFVSGSGTGGTIAGVGHYLKGQDHRIKIVLADPTGSGLYHKVKDGVMFSNQESEGKRRRHQVDTIVEGIGLNRSTANFDKALSIIDDAIRVSDEEAVAMSRYIAKQDGLFLGSSSAVNLVASLRLAQSLGKGKTIVTILCDSGSRHLSKFWNDDYLKSVGIPISNSIDHLV